MSRRHLCLRSPLMVSPLEVAGRNSPAKVDSGRRTHVLHIRILIGGTQFPTSVLSEVAVNGLRVSINQHCYRQREQSIVVADLVDHSIQTELSDEAN